MGRVIVAEAREGGAGVGSEVAEESQRLLERAVVVLCIPAVEGGSGDEAAPSLADEGGAVELWRHASK